LVAPADETFRSALAALQTGKADEAERQFKKLLRAQPRHLAGLNLLGALLAQLRRYEEAEPYIQRALKESPQSEQTLYNYGLILKALRRPAEALERFSQALAVNANVAETWNNRGTVLNDLKRHAEAIADFDRAIAINSRYPEAFCNKGKSLLELKSYDQALAAYDAALKFKPDLAEAWLGHGHVCLKLRRYDDARAAYDRASALKPDLAEPWLGRGNICHDLDQLNDALGAHDRALALNPNLAEAWLGRGNALLKLGRYDEAHTAYDRALALQPDLAEAWLGRGNLQSEFSRYEEALASYDRALALKPDLAEAWLGRGNILSDIQRYDDALAAYDRALALAPDIAEIWLSRGNVFATLSRYGDALAAYDKALALKPDLKWAQGNRLYAKLYICDWTDVEADAARLRSSVRAGNLASQPFTMLSIACSAADQLICARRFIADEPHFPKISRTGNPPHDRIRLAYLSADLHDHPLGQLMVGLFELHDRSRFEITAISFGPDPDSDLRRRIKASFEHFVDARQLSDQGIAELVGRRGIDIAVDLTGLTRGNRQNIFARRPAPIQVNYHGYPGTTGADYFDYVLADRTIIPEDQFDCYSEKVVWLPDTYQANDSQRQISEVTPSRGECGLPETGFVFCCFNNTFKILPDVFDVWMRLLQAVEGSVLWLSAANASATINLRKECERRGVSSERLVFAQRVPRAADHLARHRLADLFLDTLPYNAHTTASDALWAGLPVLTCQGPTFAGGVAASLLKAVGLPELITTSHHDYEALALKLARDRPLLASLKAKLADNRLTCPLFDTRRFARHIEAAYATMWHRYQGGESPAHFAVDPID
jgi:predicted O-linked N-acetylglucosamine transferase (SPINDLY family)